jgi:hypothetical protein
MVGYGMNAEAEYQLLFLLKYLVENYFLLEVG